MPNITIQPEYVFAIGLFITTVMLIVGFRLLVAPGEDPVRRRLQEPGAGAGMAEAVSGAPQGSLLPALTQLSEATAKPFVPKDPKNLSKLRQKMSAAGIYSPGAVQLFVSAKVALMAVGFVLGFGIGQFWGQFMAFLAGYIAVVLGYVLPTIWLSRKIRKRHAILDHSLPDALDLMVVCVESGLTLDAALQRVGNEIGMAHPEIAQELQITQMETHVGMSRADAMRNLGVRTGLPSLRSLAAMLVQAEKFGTGIAQALRVQADSLRVRRQHHAEAAAVKSTVKLAFPVVLFIFPTLLIVLGGPAVIHLIRSPIFNR